LLLTLSSVHPTDEAGQFVPSTRQTALPFTFTEEANRFVPDAVEKPSHPVDVPLVNERLEILAFVITPFVIEPFVANKFVDVVLVPVAFVHVRFVKEEGATPLIVNPETAKLVNVAFVPVKFVPDALV